jgi:hypothetical protein
VYENPIFKPIPIRVGSPEADVRVQGDIAADAAVLWPSTDGVVASDALEHVSVSTSSTTDFSTFAATAPPFEAGPAVDEIKPTQSV